MGTRPDDLNHEEHVRLHGPDPSWPRRTREEREARREEALGEMVGKTAITIRIDDDVLEAFRAAADDRGYQTLINRALREWLSAQSVKELVREEIRAAIAGVT